MPFSFKDTQDIESDLIYVNYFEKRISVHKMYKHIATDSNGDIFGYTAQPINDDIAPNIFRMQGENIGYDDQNKVIFLGHNQYNGDWRQSLRAVADLTES